MVLQTNEKVAVKESDSIAYEVIRVHKLFDLDNRTLADYIADRKCFVVVSSKIHKLYGKKIVGYLEKYVRYQHVLFPLEDNENNKNFESIQNILSEAQKLGLGRKDIMIGIGGGIILDMVGFAASMYRRRINYIRIPTTLIGYIDAGVGIKTGINFDGAKNFIGAFYPPKVCLNDYSFLQTLPFDELKSGFSEILKMAIVVDGYLFDLVEANYKILLEEQFRNEMGYKIMHMSIYDMVQQLSTNFHEKDLMRLVDFGHTFSPFIEEYSAYRISHGHAVGLDIAISTEIAFLMKLLDKKSHDRILKIFLDVGLDIYDSETFEPDKIAQSLKKIVLHRGGNLNLVLPKELGKGIFIKNLDEISVDLLREAFIRLEVSKRKYRDGEIWEQV